MKALEENIRKSREEAAAREESEKKAREEAEAKIEAERKARRELEAQMAAERASRDAAVNKAREEAERKAQAEAATAVEAQRIAHEQATAKAQAEAAARLAQAEQKAAAEKAARAAAEDRAKQESIARVMQEHTLKQRSEKEVAGKVEAELKARQQAELQAEISARVEAQKRAELAAERRQLEREMEPEQAVSAPAKKRANLGIMAVIGLVVVLGIGLAVLQFMPLTGYIPAVEKLVSDRLQEPVSIFSMRFSLMPSPQIKIERMVIGKAQDVKIDSVVIPVNSLAILDEQKNLDEIELSSVVIDQIAVPRLALWAQPQAGESKLHLSRLQLSNIKIAGTPYEMPTLQGTITLEKDGSVQKVLLRDPKINVELTPGKDGLQAKFNARNWQPPMGIAAEFANIGGTAIITKQQVVVSDLDGRIFNGGIKGNFTLKWDNALTADGNFSLNGVDVGPALGLYTRQFVASGALDLTAKFSSQAQTLDALFDAPQMNNTFTVKNGSINNVDLVRAIQSPSRNPQRGGKTSFGEISGEAQVSANRIAYRNLKLTSGPMNGTGTLDVGAAGELSGHLSLVLGSATVTVARGSLNVGGSLKDPQISSQ
jgi:chemotaxis protein histidine kinase CheA